MNLPRLLAGLATIVGAFWVLSGEHLGGVSADATVNTRLARVRAPMDGIVSLDGREIGTPVARGDMLGSVTDDRPDVAPLPDPERGTAEPRARDQDVAAPADGAGEDGSAPAPPPETAPPGPLVATGEDRLAPRASARLEAVANGLVWQTPAASGEYVLRGDVVLLIADCDAALVTASVSESTFNALTLGQAVVFRFTNASDTHAGRVVRLAGAGARSIYDDMALAPPADQSERHDVAVLIPDLRGQAGLRCLIGRTGRVFFDERPLDAVRAWLRQ